MKCKKKSGKANTINERKWKKSCLCSLISWLAWEALQMSENNSWRNRCTDLYWCLRLMLRSRCHCGPHSATEVKSFLLWSSSAYFCGLSFISTCFRCSQTAIWYDIESLHWFRHIQANNTNIHIRYQYIGHGTHRTHICANKTNVSDSMKANYHQDGLGVLPHQVK